MINKDLRVSHRIISKIERVEGKRTNSITKGLFTVLSTFVKQHNSGGWCMQKVKGCFVCCVDKGFQQRSCC